LDRGRIVELLAMLDRRLRDLDLSASLYVVGGAAVAVTVADRRVTLVENCPSQCHVRAPGLNRGDDAKLRDRVDGAMGQHVGCRQLAPASSAGTQDGLAR
jgi:hypothetical protein